jgi:hypothetical protein
MLAFLIGTTILNLFLGYALAVYLMRASQTGEYRPQLRPADRAGLKEATSSLFADAVEGTTATPLQASNQSTPATAATIGGPNVGATTSSDPTNGDAAAATSAADGDAGTQSAGAEELDQQLLAGIADFRSQLAKLRSETGQPEEGKRRPVARK